MITTRQASNGRQIYTQEVGGVALLERPEEMVERNSVQEEDVAKKRMSANLERLLNYDKYIGQPVQASSQTAQATIETKSVVETVEDKVEEYTQNDADIMPTDTTMQFGEMDGETIRAELRVEAEEQAVNSNSKSKIYLMVYAVIITVVLALIVLNTSVLASLSSSTQAKQVRVQELHNQYMELKAEYDTISSDEHVINIATNEYNMVK